MTQQEPVAIAAIWEAPDITTGGTLSYDDNGDWTLDLPDVPRSLCSQLPVVHDALRPQSITLHLADGSSYNAKAHKLTSDNPDADLQRLAVAGSALELLQPKR